MQMRMQLQAVNFIGFAKLYLASLRHRGTPPPPSHFYLLFALLPPTFAPTATAPTLLALFHRLVDNLPGSRPN
jgi:hypothetical protein